MQRLLNLGCALAITVLGSSRASAQNAPHGLGYVYLSPVPGAPYVSAQTRYILVRFTTVDPSQVVNLSTGFIAVTGAISGAHTGSTHIAGDGRTVIYTMGVDFQPNESVTVQLNPLLQPGASGSIAPYQYQFMVTAPSSGSQVAVPGEPPNLTPTNPSAKPGSATPKRARGSETLVGRTRTKAVIQANGVSVPSDFPRSVITVNSNPSPGYLFLENALDGVPLYSMILDNNGLPVWYHQGRMFDFKIQKNGMITWCSYDTNGLASFTVCDENFNYLHTYLTTNGYLTDGHELKVQPDGTYFMIGSRVNNVDLSRYGIGGTYTDVIETVIQEFTSAGELIFQWRAWDNYDIRDLPGGYKTDFPHINAIEIDEDGNILVSTRHLSEVTKINRDSGEIMWRLSGAHSTFTFVNDAFNGTSFQHHVTALGQGRYLIFDDGNYHFPTVSRAVEYQLDLTNLTATLAWQFRDTPDKYTYWMGSAQRLPTGNTLIDFVLAEYPKVIEVDANDQKRFELSLVPGASSYRAFRFPWHGAVAAPYLVLDPQPDNITLVYNKFGDNKVASYRIYGGLSPQPTELLTESTTTLTQLTDLETGRYYFRVTAVDTNGMESPFSNEENVYVNITRPGQNMVQNGDFSAGYSSWAFAATAPASAGWSIEDGASHFYVTNGGTSLSGIQLLQPGLALISGSSYVLEFDAWSSQSRYIGIQLVQSIDPTIQYTSITSPFLTPNRTHYRYLFTMQRPSDTSVNLLFNLGGSTGDVYLDNISLINPPAGDLNQDGRVDSLDLSSFVGNWLKRQTGLPGDFDGDGVVDFTDFNILGDNWTAEGP